MFILKKSFTKMGKSQFLESNALMPQFFGICLMMEFKRVQKAKFRSKYCN